MKYMTIFLCFLFFSCTNAPETTTTKEETSLKKNNTTPEDFIIAWNNALNERDWEKAAQFYDDEVYIYGLKKSKAEILADKKKYFEKNEDFQQQVSDFDGRQIFYDTEEIYFTKTYLGDSGKEKTADCFFSIFKNEMGNWKIIEETDRQSVRKNRTNKNDITDCSEFWYALFKSNPKIKEYKKFDYLLRVEFREDEIHCDVREEGEFTDPFIDAFYFSLKENKMYQTYANPDSKKVELKFSSALLQRMQEFCR